MEWRPTETTRLAQDEHEESVAESYACGGCLETGNPPVGCLEEASIAASSWWGRVSCEFLG